MRWGVTVYGHPVSWDSAYRTGLIPVSRKIAGRRVPVLNPDGTPKLIHRPRLTEEADQWKIDVITQVKPAIPSGWHPEGQIRVTIELFLLHDMDCDNATKLIFDGVQRAAKARGLKLDDMQFIPCYQPKVFVTSRMDAKTILTFDDEIGRHR
jgi:hypothetical protein